MKRQHSMDQLDSVLREFRAGRFCIVNSLVAIERGNAGLIPRDAKFGPRDLRLCRGRFEATYTLRVFSHFEATLRDYWQTVRPRAVFVPAEVLVNQVGSRRNITPDTVSSVHQVRDLRNRIAHHFHASSAVGIFECKSRLARFLSFLPQDW